MFTLLSGNYWSGPKRVIKQGPAADVARAALDFSHLNYDGQLRKDAPGLHITYAGDCIWESSPTNYRTAPTSKELIIAAHNVNGV